MSSTNPHYMRNYSRLRRNERKQWALKQHGNKCCKCGAIEDLEFDHIDRKTKRINVSEMWMYKLETFLEEFRKCQLLCQKCHLDKSRKDGSLKTRGETKHGTGTAYVGHKCRCLLCREWKRKYSREWMRNYRKKKKAS